MVKVLSLHWGFLPGGIARYAEIIDKVSLIAPVKIESVCLIAPSWHTDYETLSMIAPDVVSISSRYDFSWIKKVACLIDEKKPDIIMSHGFNGHFVAMLCGFFTKVSVVSVCSYHGRYFPPSWKHRFVSIIYNVFTEYFLRVRAMAIVTVSDFSKQYLVSKGIAASKITVIHNGIDDIEVSYDKDRKRLREEWNVADHELLLGSIGRLDPIKGISFLIDGFAEALKQRENLKLCIVGAGPLKDDLEGKVISMDLADKIIFTGYRSDVNECLAAFDIYVLPSLEENHSISLLEAMRARKTIIATDVGGNSESVRNESEALLVPKADSRTLNMAIQKYCKESYLITKLANNAYYRFRESFTTNKMIQSMGEWFEYIGKNLA